ncbi:MAG: prepilin-type N-terminal cleavage/methylation domain-containing protein, partial [Deltaproteobacteria bacterium]|nr:prepilin-type N-terminal cleavage/methylation domain-containing protein [Deltaproteobacteria bacterium]
MTGKQKTIGLETGFTLIEMLVVIVLIGLLFSLTLPRFSGIGETEKLRKAARLMARQALKAHSQAVTEAQPYFLCLDLDLSRT